MQKGVGSFVVSVLLLTAAVLVATTGEAQAFYLDPGSGSLIIQILLATVFGSLFVIKGFWRRVIAMISGFFARFKKSKNSTR